MKNLLFVMLALLAAPGKAQTTVPFHQKGAMILIDAQVNGHTATLLLDTGADYSIVSPEARWCAGQAASSTVHRRHWV